MPLALLFLLALVLTNKIKMKKIIFLFLLFTSFSIYSQNDLKVLFGCFDNGESINLNTIKKTKRIHILGTASNGAGVKKWELVIQVKKGKAYTFKANSSLITPQMRDELLKNFKRTEYITIQNVTVSAFNSKTNKYEEKVLEPIKLTLNAKAVNNCDEKNTQAQDDLVLQFSCFKNGDSASIKDILHYPTFTIINSNPQVDIKIISYNYVVPMMDGRRNPQGLKTISNNELELNSQSFDMAKKLMPGENFVLSDIVVQFNNRKTKATEAITVAPIVINVAKRSGFTCGEFGSDSLLVLEYNGKLLTGKDKNVPLVRQRVFLKDSRDSVIQTTYTNSYGDFTFKNLKADENYLISIPVEDNVKIKDMQIHLAKVDGTILKTLEKSGNSFSYKVLPSELHVLAKADAEDTELKIKNFGKSSQSELIVIEDIYYAPNSAEISEESMKQLDKIVRAMKENQALKLAISSHTDATGEDSYNMTLSEKRAKNVQNYLIAEGILVQRLSAKGYGETQIKNRCKNGVDCSELEHELNRRTEFKFTK